MGSQAFRPA